MGVVLLIAASSLVIAEPAIDLRRMVVPQEGTADAKVDGSESESWTQRGTAQFNMSKRYQEKRDESLKKAQEFLDTFIEKIKPTAYELSDEVKKELKKNMRTYNQRKFDEPEYLAVSAVDYERKRLRMLVKAFDAAQRLGGEAPDSIDLSVVRKLGRSMEGREDAIKNSFKAFRKLAEGLKEYTRKEPKEGLAALEEASKLAPDEPIIKIYLGAFYQHLGQGDRALEVWREAARLDPSNSDLAKKIGGAAPGKP